MTPKPLLLGTIAATATWGIPTQAHDIYTHLTNRWGAPCCDPGNCRPAPYRVSSSGVQMMVNQTWFVVPNAMVQYRHLEGDTGETAGGHWCGEPHEGTFITYCAILPPNFASGTEAGTSTPQRWRERYAGRPSEPGTSELSRR